MDRAQATRLAVFVALFPKGQERWLAKAWCSDWELVKARLNTCRASWAKIPDTDGTTVFIVSTARPEGGALVGINLAYDTMINAMRAAGDDLLTQVEMSGDWMTRVRQELPAILADVAGEGGEFDFSPRR